MPASPVFGHLKNFYEGGKGDNRTSNTAAAGVIQNLINDVEKSTLNAGMLGKKLVRHRHFYPKSTASVRHWHSGITPISRVTDYM
jgi:hypothetical protein